MRVDSGVYQGYTIPPYYDSLIGKLIVHGRNRDECLMRLRRALDEFVVDGIKTTIPLFRELVDEPDIADGDYDIHWLEKYLGRTQLTRGRDDRAATTSGIDITPSSCCKAYASASSRWPRSADDPELFWVEPETRGIIPLDGFHVPQAPGADVRAGRLRGPRRSRFRRR